MRSVRIASGLACLGMLVTATAASALNSLYVDWGTLKSFSISVSRINYDGTNTLELNNVTRFIGPAVGELGPAGNRTPLGKIFCVDVFQFADDQAAYDVEVYDQSDGETGWRQPDNDSDEYRAIGGLAKAAAAANYFGFAWVDGPLNATDREVRRIALNLALWKKSYGDALSFNGYGAGNWLHKAGAGYSTVQDYYELIMGTTLADATSYSWYDSRGEDLVSNRQDMLRPVPEPSALMVVGIALAGLGLGQYRRRRRS